MQKDKRVTLLILEARDKGLGITPRDLLEFLNVSLDRVDPSGPQPYMAVKTGFRQQLVKVTLSFSEENTSAS